jgi:hypothetical protein
LIRSGTRLAGRDDSKHVRPVDGKTTLLQNSIIYKITG